MTEQQPHPFNGRITETDEPMPAYRQPEPPQPNDEDREAEAATGKSAAYWAEMRVVRTQVEWEAARQREAARQTVT